MQSLVGGVSVGPISGVLQTPEVWIPAPLQTTPVAVSETPGQQPPPAAVATMATMAAPPPVAQVGGMPESAGGAGEDNGSEGTISDTEDHPARTDHDVAREEVR
ncbi:unnamed protein product, partial [Discosporangium mesarthrocarpum]